MLQSISHQAGQFTEKQEKKLPKQFENVKEKQKSKEAKGNVLSELLK